MSTLSTCQHAGALTAHASTETGSFIGIQPGRAGPITYAIIFNPHYVIRYHHEQKTPGLNLGDYNALLDRAGEVGAKDMLEGLPTQPAAAAAAPAAPPLPSAAASLIPPPPSAAPVAAT